MMWTLQKKKKKEELYDVNTVSLIWWNSEAYFKR